MISKNVSGLGVPGVKYLSESRTSLMVLLTLGSDSCKLQGTLYVSQILVRVAFNHEGEMLAVGTPRVSSAPGRMVTICPDLFSTIALGLLARQ
jgi:hypothetical protein